MKTSRLFAMQQWSLLGSAVLLAGVSVYYLVEIIPQLRAAFFQEAVCGCEHIVSVTHNPTLTGFLVALAVLAVGILATMVAAAVKHLLAARRHIRSLDIHSTEVVLHHNRSYTVHTFIASDVSIFTAGILRPAIYMSSSAVETLTPAERNSVLLHEIGHIRHFDILRRVIIASVLSVLRWIPGNTRIAQAVEFAQEQTADEFATVHTERKHVMSALIKLLETERAYTPSGIAAFVVNEARLEHLLLEPIRFPMKMAFAAVLFTVGMLISTTAVFAAGFGVLDYVEDGSRSMSAASCVDATMSVEDTDDDEDDTTQELEGASWTDINSTPANMSTDLLTPPAK